MAGDEKKIVERLVKLTRIGGGVLTAEAVVADARDPKSPLHDRFDWDDEVAAEKWRLEQARRLIRSVRLDVEVSEDVIAVPKYVHVPDVGYRETAVVRGQETVAREALDYELRRMAAALERLLAVADGLGMRGEVTEIENSIRATIARLAA